MMCLLLEPLLILYVIIWRPVLLGKHVNCIFERERGRERETLLRKDRPKGLDTNACALYNYSTTKRYNETE